MIFEEALRNTKVIDKLDDERRGKLFGIMKWRTDMNIYSENTFSTFKIYKKEKLDDDLREYLIGYTIECREKLKKEVMNNLKEI